MCRLQKFWLPSTSSLLLLFAAEVFAAEPVAKLYSALGEPLMAEVQLSAAEQQASTLSVEGGGYSWMVLPIPDRGAILLLSEEKVTQPILELTLHADSMVRPLVLLPDPVAPYSSRQFLQQLIAAHSVAVEQRATLQQQLEQIQLQPRSGLEWLQLPEGVVASRWLLFLLLGLLAVLLMLRWWRSAEWVNLDESPRQQGVVVEGDTALSRFQREVAQLEAEIQPPQLKRGNG